MSAVSDRSVRWIVDGNNVFGSRPDGWWNDRPAAMVRVTQRIAQWCRSHADPVTVVFDQPVPDEALALGGGNLTVRAATRRGRNAADDLIVALTIEWQADSSAPITVVTSDRGLRARLAENVTVMGVGAFREQIDY